MSSLAVNNRTVNQQVGTRGGCAGRIDLTSASECSSGAFLLHRAVHHLKPRRGGERLQTKHFDRIRNLGYNLTSFVVLSTSHHIPIARCLVQNRGINLLHFSSLKHSLITVMGFPNPHESQHIPTRNRDNTFKNKYYPM